MHNSLLTKSVIKNLEQKDKLKAKKKYQKFLKLDTKKVYTQVEWNIIIDMKLNYGYLSTNRLVQSLKHGLSAYQIARRSTIWSIICQ